MRYLANMIWFTTVMHYDIQVYIPILPEETWLDVSEKMEACLAAINIWTCAKKLNLNREETELIIFNPHHQSRRINEDILLQVPEEIVCIAESVIYLEKQVFSITKASCYCSHNIGRIRCYITRNDTQYWVFWIGFSSLGPFLLSRKK